MSCDPHPQIMSPCADDAVSVDQVLGTRGDINFDENGSLALTAGQTTAVIAFRYQKETSDYRFEYLYVKSIDANPADVRPVVKAQTTQNFTVDFGGEPITANSTLYWRVVVPDQLHVCQGAAGGPKYAIIKPSQEGSVLLDIGAESAQVTFPLEQPDNTWLFECLEIDGSSIGLTEEELIATPDAVQAFAITITNRTAQGFVVSFSGATEHSGYVLLWRIR